MLRGKLWARMRNATTWFGTHDLVDNAASAVDDAGDTTTDMVEKARDSGSDLLDQVSDFTRENPTRAVAIIAGIAAVLVFAFIASSRRH